MPDLNQAGSFNGSDTGGDGSGGYYMDAIAEALRATAYSWVPVVFTMGRKDTEHGLVIYRCADIAGNPPHGDGSCIIQTEGANAGGWYDHQSGRGGGPISTIKEHYNLSSDETLSFCAGVAEKYGGGSYLRKEKRFNGNGNGGAGQHYSDSQKNIANANFLLSVASQGIANTPVQTYLQQGRGIRDIPLSPDMYFYALATQPQNSRGYPTWIMRFSDPYDSGNYSGGIHRIFLADDGSRHIGADGLKPKMMLGPVDGAVIRFALPSPDGLWELARGQKARWPLCSYTACRVGLLHLPATCISSPRRCAPRGRSQGCSVSRYGPMASPAALPLRLLCATLREP
jgi:hypothetical protein